VPIKTVYTGIRFDDVRSGLGLVPEYEEREVALFNGCPWHVWSDLPGSERAAAVAHYRMHHLVSLHVSDAVRRQAT